MENKSHAFVAGLFALLLGAVAIVALFWLRGTQNSLSEYVVVTKYTVGGLNPEAQVRYRGIRVGKVKDIQLDRDDPSDILIKISIPDNIPLTRGTVAKLATQGVTGIAHVLLLDSGKDNAPLIATDGRLPRIAMVPSLLDEMSESGPAALRQAQEVMTAANALLNEENRRRFAATMANLESASASMKPAIENMNAALVQVRKLLDDKNVKSLSRAAGELGPLLADTRQLVGKMHTTAEKLDVAIGDASAGGTSALMPRLNELAADFSLTSRQLSRVLRLLEDSPQGLVFGVPAPPPGPGEPGFMTAEGR
ncbi:MAG: MCE family protein [Dechloromonas sp.]|uniref:MCE family protein n=1 Tax=Candidatus Dechloromonas phosphorivorans TaxID=2899244 RepID=A0A9D7LS20_9RHOO|nr:MCE family protein [Candidatus Dechloromonas phosphorivorans]